jgi:hypothetical protein
MSHKPIHRLRKANDKTQPLSFSLYNRENYILNKAALDSWYIAFHVTLKFISLNGTFKCCF